MLMGELQDIYKKPFANLEQVESSEALVLKYHHGILMADGSWHHELLRDGHSEWMLRQLRKTNDEDFKIENGCCLWGVKKEKTHGQRNRARDCSNIPVDSRYNQGKIALLEARKKEVGNETWWKDSRMTLHALCFCCL